MDKLKEDYWQEYERSYFSSEQRLLSEPNTLDNTITQVCSQTTKLDIFKQNINDVLILWFVNQVENQCESIDGIHIRLFSSIYDLIDYLVAVETSNIFLIIDYSLASNFLSILDEFPQILFIYILKHIEDEDTLLITDARRSIRHISDDIHTLFLLINEDIHTSTSNSLYSTLFDFRAEEETTTQIQNKSFIWDYLLIDTLFDSSISSDTAKAELVEYCRQQYINEKIQPPKAITEFEKDYSSKDAIKWYTRGSFLFSLLNLAFRKRDIDAIFKFRFFLVDFQKQLEQCCSDEIVRTQQTLYRGQLISELELTKLKKSINAYVSFNTYLSTTKNEGVALMFGSHVTSIVFEIELDFDVQLKNKRFCPVSVQNMSYNPDEDEVIFPIGAVFLLKSIEMKNNRTYIILKPLNSHEYNEMIIMIETFFPTKLPSKFRIAELLYSLGDYKKVEPYIEMLMKDFQLTSNQNNIGYVYDLMGRFQCGKSNYEVAQSYFEKALENIEATNTYHATIYYHIGNLYREKTDFNKALQSLQDALKYKQELNPLELTDVYDMFGLIYIEMGNFDDALSYLNQTLYIYQSYSLPQHNYLTTYFLLTLVHLRKSDYTKSLQYLDNAFQISLEVLPKYHPAFISLHALKGYIYFYYKDFVSAQLHLQKAFDLIETTKRTMGIYKPILHIFICNVLVELHTSYENITTRFHYAKKALEILDNYEKIIPENDSMKRIVYNHMADVYYISCDYESALKLLNEMLNLWTDNDYRTLTFFNIGNIYLNQNNMKVAEDYFNQSLELLYQMNQSVTNTTLIPWIKLHLCSIYKNGNNFEKAILLIKEALQLQRQRSTPNFDFIAHCHIHLMELCPNEKENYLNEIHQLVKNDNLSLSGKFLCHKFLGLHYQLQENWSTAFFHFQSSLDVELTFNPPCYHYLINIYADLGDTSKLIKGTDSEIALYHYERSRDIYLELLKMKTIPIKDKQKIYQAEGQIVETVQESVDLTGRILLVYNSIAECYAKKRNNKEVLDHVQFMEQILTEYKGQKELEICHEYNGSKELQIYVEYLEGKALIRKNAYYFMIASIYNSIQYYDKAILNYKKSFRYTLEKKNYHEYGFIYQLIALAYYRKKDNLMSISNYNIALTFLHNSPSLNDQNLAECYAATARAYDNIPNYKYAYIYYQQAIKHYLLCTPIDYSSLFRNHISATHALYLSRPWNCNEQLKYLLTIMKFRRHFSKESLNDVYYNAGVFANYSEQYNSALAYFKKVFEYSKNSNDIIGIYQQQRYNLMLIGELDKAYDVTKKSIDCQVSMKDVNFISLLDCYIGAGLICYQNGKYQSALMYYLLAFYILQKHPNDKQNDYYTRLYSCIACVHLEYGEITSAHDLCSKASETHFLTDDKTRIATIIFYMSRGLVECKLDNYYVALDYFGQAWEYLYNENHYYHHWHRILYNYIGYAYFKVGQVEIAMKHYIKSLSMYKDCRTHPCRAEVYKNIGLIYKQDSTTYYIALSYYKRALKQITNHKHPHYILYKSMIATLEKKMSLWHRLKAFIYSFLKFGY